jgi:hypothetical protein
MPTKFTGNLILQQVYYGKEGDTMNKPAKIALYFLVIGGALLLGGIASQMIVGISLMDVTDESVERFGYMVMSRGSIMLVAAYAMVFLSGIAFWLLGPYELKRDRWFLIAFLCFYIWLPVDIYTIILDIRFAVLFNPGEQLTEELKSLFMSRQQTLGPIPLIMLLGYLTAIGMAVFRPGFKSKTKMRD